MEAAQKARIRLYEQALACVNSVLILLDLLIMLQPLTDLIPFLCFLHMEQTRQREALAYCFQLGAGAIGIDRQVKSIRSSYDQSNATVSHRITILQPTILESDEEQFLASYIVKS